MELELRRACPEDLDALFEADARAFGFTWDEQAKALRVPLIELDRFHVIVDGPQIVGIAGAFSFEMTVPGGATVPACGVTWVSVQPTHRRRGLLRRLMEAVHADARSRGESVAILTASEAGIYERFGYGTVSSVRPVSIDLRTVSLRDDVYVEAVRSATLDATRVHVERLWDRFRLLRATEVARTQTWWDVLFAVRSKPQDDMSASTWLLHEEGYASYRRRENWEFGRPAGTVEVTEFVALTPVAHASLWKTLLDIDLASELRTAELPLDDPLVHLVSNARGLETKALYDHYWLCPLEPSDVLRARRYATEDRLVVELRGEGLRYEVEGGPGGATVRRVRAKPQLELTRAALGAISMGGVSLSTMIGAGRASANDSATVLRADAFFRTTPLPFAQTRF